MKVTVELAGCKAAEHKLLVKGSDALSHSREWDLNMPKMILLKKDLKIKT